MANKRWVAPLIQLLLLAAICAPLLFISRAALKWRRENCTYVGRGGGHYIFNCSEVAKNAPWYVWGE